MYRIMKDPQLWVNLSFDLYHVYGKRGKAYHGLHHIEELFDELDKLIDLGLIENEEAMRLAIWYHDYFQDHDGKDEENSAQKGYGAAIALGYPEAFAQIVSRLILVTKHSIPYLPETNDEKFICDLDLAAFAYEDFPARSESVRVEYPDVPEDTFYKARRDVLRGFLKRSHIYHTDHFRTTSEGLAKRNLMIVTEPPKFTNAIELP